MTARVPYTLRRMLRRNLIGLIAGLLLLFPGCAAGVAQAYRNHLPTEPVAGAPGDLVITGQGYEMHAAGKVTSAAAKEAWAGVLATLNGYLEAAVLAPLRSGGPAGDLTPLFTPPAAQRVMTVGPDRFAVIDENLPPVSDVRAESAVAGLNGLAGPDGIMSVVTAGLDLRLIGHINGALVRVTRTGELVLMPEGGTWRIDAYDVQVTRTLADDTTTTTVRS